MSSNLHKYKNIFLSLGIVFVLILIALTAYSWYLLFESSLSRQALENSNKNFERLISEKLNHESVSEEIESPEDAYTYEQKQQYLNSLNEVDGEESTSQSDVDALDASNKLGNDDEPSQTDVAETSDNSANDQFESEAEIYIEESYDDTPDETGYSESQKRNALTDLDTVYPEEEVQSEDEVYVDEGESGASVETNGEAETEEQVTDDTEGQMQSESEFYDDFYENDPYLQENPNG